MFIFTGKYYHPSRKEWTEINVGIDKKLNYDYSHCKWFAIDGEFTGIYPHRDRSVIWSICSEDTDGNLRIEMLYVYDDDADLTKLKELISSDKEKLLWYGKLDIAFLIQLTGIKMAQPIYDIKLASILTRTYTQENHLSSLCSLYIDPKIEIIPNKNDPKVNARRDWMTDFTTWPIELHQYNVDDVIYLNHFAKHMKPATQKAKREELIATIMRALPELAEIYAMGFYRDVFAHNYDSRESPNIVLR